MMSQGGMNIKPKLRAAPGARGPPAKEDAVGILPILFGYSSPFFLFPSVLSLNPNPSIIFI